MAVEIECVTEVSDELAEAFARLMPQLSPRLGALSRQAIERVVCSDGAALFAARGCGAGEALVKAATEHAARIGAAKVMLTSNPAREAARGLYRKIGFEEAGTTVFVFKTDRK